MSAKETDAELEAAALNRVLEAFKHYRQYSVSWSCADLIHKLTEHMLLLMRP
jgi:hypothetical protein